MRVSGLLIGLALLITSGSALAFCRTTTCGPGECTTDPACSFCLEGGLPLYWPRGCVSFSVQQNGSPKTNISAQVASQYVENALLTWISANCGTASPSIGVYDFGLVECTAQEYNQDDGNANIWVFRDKDWPYVSVGSTLALTTLTFNVETGEIFDADVEINSLENPLTLNGANPVQADFASIVTHEAGHFLGLSHSCAAGATMEANYKFGDISLRDLSADDVAGICAVYPPGTDVSKCNPTPRHGYSAKCGGPEEKGCCTTAPGQPRPHAIWAVAVSLLGAGLLGARRRKRESATRPNS